MVPQYPTHQGLRPGRPGSGEIELLEQGVQGGTGAGTAGEMEDVVAPPLAAGRGCHAGECIVVGAVHIAPAMGEGAEAGDPLQRLELAQRRPGPQRLLPPRRRRR